MYLLSCPQWWSGKMSPIACSKMHCDTAINFEWKNVHFKFKQHRSHFEKGTYTRNDTGRINLRPLTTSNILCHWEYPATEPLWLPFLSQTSTGRVSVSKGTWHLVMVMTMPFNPVFATSNCTSNTLSTEAEIVAWQAVVNEPSKGGAVGTDVGNGIIPSAASSCTPHAMIRPEHQPIQAL